MRNSFSFITLIVVGIICLLIGILAALVLPNSLGKSVIDKKISEFIPQTDVEENGVTKDETPVTRTIYIITFDPILKSKGGKRLSEYKKWNDSYDLSEQAIKELHELSGGYVTYKVAKSQIYDSFTKMPDGFQYDESSYLACLDNPKACRSDFIDYQWLVDTYNLCDPKIDEVWLWGGPYFGFDSFRPIKDCEKKFYVMGFNFERGLPEMLFAIGGRMDSISRYRIAGDVSMANEFVPFNPKGNDAWTRFVRACGTSYAPPNTDTFREYAIFDSQTSIASNCQAWINFPNLEKAPEESINCEMWGCNNVGFQRWWFSKIPRNPGITNDTNGTIYNNWWKYYINLQGPEKRRS